MDTPFSLTIQNGSATPLGASKQGSGVNFALFSQHASQVALTLFNIQTGKKIQELSLDFKRNKTGYIWHIWIQGLPEQFDYAYHVEGPQPAIKGHSYNVKYPLIDPYARLLNTSTEWGDTHNFHEVAARFCPCPPFDWGSDVPPQIPYEKLIIYEMHVRGFTKHSSSGVKEPGTFEGLIEKIPYLKELGITAVELLPIFEFNENENTHKSSKTDKRLYNYWGYSTVQFFAPMARYSAPQDPCAPILAFKKMVKALHKENIEVILDVVFNHTAEDGSKEIYYNFKGIDNCIYYMLGENGRYLDFTGCGNTFNCNHPVVKELIIQSLRYWVSEMHVDGFRFDLASIFCRNEHGIPLPNPPLVKAISDDPILANVKLIAEPWDAAGLYQVGHFPSFGKWAEWNGLYRDTVRRFLKGTDQQVSAFASALSGSQELYGIDRCPYHSINFITAHDGFTLRDLVSYQKKHNEENGENNRDGMNQNDNWNCGYEGVTQDIQILKLRERQMRNHFLALMVSIGTPMMLMGDEYGHSRNGNNNAYCLDSEKNWQLWDQLQQNRPFYEFCKKAIQFRKTHPVLQRTKFIHAGDVDWHGHLPFQPNWNSDSRFIAYTINDPHHRNLYIAFNANYLEAQISLPNPTSGQKWKKIVDTSLEHPLDFQEESQASTIESLTYLMPPYSALVLESL